MLDQLAPALRTLAAAVADSNDRQRSLIQIRRNLPSYLQREVRRLPDHAAVSNGAHQCGLIFNEMDVNFLKLNADRHGLSFRASVSVIRQQVAFHSPGSW